MLFIFSFFSKENIPVYFKRKTQFLVIIIKAIFTALFKDRLMSSNFNIYFLSTLFTALFLDVAAQGTYINTIPVKIQWDAAPKAFSNDAEKYFLTFRGAAFDESEMLPIKTERVNLNGPGTVRLELQRAVYEPIGNSVEWGQAAINNEILFKSEVSAQRGSYAAVIQFVPIRKNPLTGQYEKLMSGDLKIYAETSRNPAPAKTKNLQVSKLNDGQIYKFTVSGSGIYKLDYNFLQSLGVDVQNIDPRNIQILGNGGKSLSETVGSALRIDDLMENAVYVQGESDGSFDNSDYLIFYAQGNDYWTYNSADSIFNRFQNIYTDNISYFVKISGNQGKRIGSRASIASTAYNTSTYDALQHYESNELNLMEKEFALPPSGRLWVGDPFQISRSQTFNFSFPNRIASDTVKIQSIFYSRAFNQGSYEVKANNSSIFSSNISSVNNYIYSIYARTLKSRVNFFTATNNIDINILYNNSSSTSEAWLDYITLNARCLLSFSGGQMSFRDIRTLGKGTASYQLSNAATATVWDVTDPYNVEQQQHNGSSFGAPADILRSFVIFDGSNFMTPTAVGSVANQNLHGINTSPQLLIVYHQNFQAAALRLAAHRAAHSNMTVLAVDVALIYNEFSSGHPDITSIRDFAKMLYDRSSGNDSLRYLLLFGAGSFDYKGLNPARSRDNNYILAYETDTSDDPLKTYTSDDYFALLDDGEGNMGANSLLDIAIGRLPVTSASDAEAVVDKIIRYDTDPELLGDWKNRLTFFADDQDGNLHMNDTEGIAANVAARDSVYNVDKIYCDAYPQVSTSGGSRYPDVNAAILRNIFKGSLAMTYLGHGGADGLAQERIFTTSEINSLDNQYKLPLFVTATCSFAPVDDPEYTSAGQLLILNPSGGAIALLTTVRVVLADANEYLVRKTFESFFVRVNGRMPTVGEVLQNAKNNSGVLSASNTRKYLLLGDPSMTLAYPEQRVVTTTINGNPVSGNDTIRALQRVTISGEIQDNSGNLLSNFNGTVYPTVFDKPDTIWTRGNDADSYISSFPLQKKVIFKGRATVANGRFTFSFIVPVDINYTLGYGKLSYYADNGTEMDANGAYLDILIGGTDPNAASDDRGPEVSVFMNNENFASGGITDENPLLFVKLKDDSGINTVGNGIGHDLTGLLTYIQDEHENIYSLNDFYEANMDDFTSGTINYPLQSLPVGKHTMKVKAWDVYNNMGEGSTEFIVAADAKMALAQVLNYPNPFTTHTEFMFEHNLPGQELEVLIQIFTVSGKIVKTISQDLSTAENDGYRARGIEWDGLDDFGDRLGRGVYVYKVTVRATGPAPSGSEEPTIQKNSEYQKLVILK